MAEHIRSEALSTPGRQAFLAALRVEENALVRALDAIRRAIVAYSDSSCETADLPVFSRTTTIAAPLTQAQRHPKTVELRRFSPDRDAVIIENYPNDVPEEEIREMCLAFPGAPIPVGMVKFRANKLGVKRSKGRVASTPVIAGDVTLAPTVNLSGLSAIGTVIERKPPTVSSPPARTDQAPQPKSRMEALMVVSRSVDTNAKSKPFSMLGGTVRVGAPV